LFQIKEWEAKYKALAESKGVDTKLLMAGRPAVETRTVGLQVGWPDKSIAKGTASTGTGTDGEAGGAGDLASPGGSSGGGGKETKDSGVGPDFHDEFVIAVPDLPMASPPPSAGSSASSGSAASGESKTSASGSSDGGLTSPSGSESGGLDSHKDFTEELTGKGPKLVVAQTPVKASPSSDKLEAKDGAAAGTPATPGSARSGAGALFALVCSCPCGFTVPAVGALLVCLSSPMRFVLSAPQRPRRLRRATRTWP
jgi:hypothetical protein